jgi:hypothetical protein
MPEDFIQFLDYHYSIICLCCGKKVMDPDKKKNQIHLKGKCPSCGLDSKEQKKKNKRDKKNRNKQENLACRGKYVSR